MKRTDKVILPQSFLVKISLLEAKNYFTPLPQRRPQIVTKGKLSCPEINAFFFSFLFFIAQITNNSVAAFLALV